MDVEARLDRLTGILEALASTVVAHDDQIEALIKVGEAQDRRIEALGKRVDDLAKSVAATERQWQAYVNTLPRQ